MTNNHSSTANEIWAVADLLRGDFRQSQYGRIILPFALLRRLECVLADTKDAVLAKAGEIESMPIEIQGPLLLREASSDGTARHFYNTSLMDLSKLGETGTADNLEAYINAFSDDAREIFEHFRFSEFIRALDEANLLYLVIKRFANWDLSPEAISNHEMGLAFEELIRKFAESSNDTAGEHFTPRDIVRLTTALVFGEDDDALNRPGIVRSIYDPTAGTGGFLSNGMEYLHELNEQARLAPFGQELNPESYAICKADMLIKGQDVSNIKLGNTLSDDQLPADRFDYMLSNPPFGVDWKKVQRGILDEHKVEGFDGRFGPGLPRVSDGSLLFLMHLVSKMRAVDPQAKKSGDSEGGSRIGIILNGSPLFTGGAGSGESEIRRYLLESDLVEAIIALPTDMFYNTGIATYIWVLCNHKTAERKGKVQLIQATETFEKMSKSLGSKRKVLSDEQIDAITASFGRAEAHEADALGIVSKLFPTTAFGYRRITVERPLQLRFDPQDEDKRAALVADAAWEKLVAKDKALTDAILDGLKQLDATYLARDQFQNALTTELKKAGFKLAAAQWKLLAKHLGEHDEEAEICRDSKGKIEPDPGLRDNENVPLDEAVADYFAREVTPHVPEAWIDETKRDEKDGEVGIVGYEIPFNRHFYTYTPPRDLEEIDAELAEVTGEIQELLKEISA
ncbi:class I SAM-dependent DNA methyltransferase [Verrucomicrobiales bacterium BCK34]|nr:class I SAM-dependent DNA methyltransferase [Verrucomicrobiales bacterium BCK34]